MTTNQPHEAAEKVRSTLKSATDRAVNATEEATETAEEVTTTLGEKAKYVAAAVRDSDEVRRLRAGLPYAAFGVALVTYPPAAAGMVAERIAEPIYRQYKERRRRGNTPEGTQS